MFEYNTNITFYDVFKRIAMFGTISKNEEISTIFDEFGANIC
jgi:hypothetical protein